MSLPNDPLSAYLTGNADVRVVGVKAISTRNEVATIQDTERTYAFMAHISESLGVNCTGCHNTRSFFAWDQGRPQRVPAWYGIRMARDLNNNYVIPLTSAFPATRLGPAGDVAKIGCSTCHQGVSKPLNGVSMLKDYPELHPPVTPAEVGPAAVGPAEVAPAEVAPSEPVAPARTGA
jgi:photosynthetic reaction center cytochrome c subunit